MIGETAACLHPLFIHMWHAHAFWRLKEKFSSCFCRNQQIFTKEKDGLMGIQLAHCNHLFWDPSSHPPVAPYSWHTAVLHWQALCFYTHAKAASWRTALVSPAPDDSRRGRGCRVVGMRLNVSLDFCILPHLSWSPLFIFFFLMISFFFFLLWDYSFFQCMKCNKVLSLIFSLPQ